MLKKEEEVLFGRILEEPNGNKKNEVLKDKFDSWHQDDSRQLQRRML